MKTKVHFLQTYIVLLSGIAATLLPVSCSQADSPSAGVTTDASTGETSRVEILIPRNLTRTYISDDEGEDLENDDYEGKRAVVEWNEGDQLVMWSKALTDGSALSAPATFTYLAPSFNVEYDGILFYCDNVEIPATLSTYSYYAVSPVPDNADDRYAYFTIPAEQGGRYDHDYKGAVPDILWAPPVQGKRLMQDVRNPIDFSFKHMLHTMKITVPEVPFDDGIKQMRIEFPYNVAGKLRIDLESGETLLTEGSNAITLTFDTPKKAGDTFWVFVAPYDAAGSTGSGKVHFIATDGTDFTYPKESDDNAFDFSTFTARSITPVRLRGLTKHESVDFTVTMQDNHLGEDVDALLTLPDNGSENNVFAMLEQSKTRKIHFEGKSQTVTIKMFKDVFDRIKNQTLTVMLESEHAEGFDVSNTVTSNTFNFTAPYLFFEDFSTVEGFSQDDGYVRGSIAGNKEYGPFLDGWSGGRIGAMAGTAIRIACRRETGLANYGARVDSAPIKHLKNGSTVKVSVQYDYGMDRWGGYTVGLWGSDSRNEGKDAGQTVHLGYIKNSDVHNSGDETMTEVSIFYIKELAPSGGQDAGYTNITHTDGNFQIPDCDKETRMTWRTVPDDIDGADNNTCWFYIDNVRVSIVP